jgi:hypothetical protein
MQHAEAEMPRFNRCFERDGDPGPTADRLHRFLPEARRWTPRLSSRAGSHDDSGRGGCAFDMSAAPE